jgi:hypothetical protein
MDKDKIILLAAVAFAGSLVLKKSGGLSKLLPSLSFGSSAPLSFGNTNLGGVSDNGYNPANPGAYVPIFDLLNGAADNDWLNMPTFSQTVDAVLGTTTRPRDSIVNPDALW